MTMEAWFKLDGDSGGTQMIVGQNWGYMIDVNASTGQVRWIFHNTPFSNQFKAVGVPGGIPIGEWHHVAVSRLAAGPTWEIRTFYDGQLIDTDTSHPTSMIWCCEGDLTLGSVVPPTIPMPFWGSIDDVRLSSAAIYITDFLPVSRPLPDADTAALWDFNDDSSGLCVDISGNGHDIPIIDGILVPDECHHDPALTCGNTIIEPFEDCEGTDHNGEDCMTLGYASGTLDCTSLCAFDTTGCTPFEHALSFDGVNDCVWIAPLFGSSTTTEVTVEMWVRTTDSTGIWRTMFSHRANWRDVAFHWVTGEIVWGYALPSTNYQARTAWPLGDGAWHHLAGTFSAPVLRLYVDGNLIAENLAAGPYMDWGSSMWDTIGCNGTDAQKFPGDIRQVRVSNYERYTTDFTPEWILIEDLDTEAMWHFDEGSGLVAGDSAGGNDGAVDGATWILVP
jgi:hypothetical protein